MAGMWVRIRAAENTLTDTAGRVSVATTRECSARASLCRPVRPSAKNASRTGAPAASSGATSTHRTMCSTMRADSRSSAAEPIPEVQVDDQERQSADKAASSAERPAAPASVPPLAALGRRQIDEADRYDERQEHGAGDAVHAPVEHEPVKAHALLEDLGGAVAAGQMDLVRPGAVRLLVEVDEEVLIKRERPVGLPLSFTIHPRMSG